MSEWSKNWVRLEEIPKKCFSSNQWNSRFAWHWGVRFNVIHSGPLKAIKFYLKGHVFRYKLSFCGYKVFICVGLNFLENVSCFVLFMALVIHSSFLSGFGQPAPSLCSSLLTSTCLPGCGCHLCHYTRPLVLLFIILGITSADLITIGFHLCYNHLKCWFIICLC